MIKSKKNVDNPTLKKMFKMNPQDQNFGKTQFEENQKHKSSEARKREGKKQKDSFRAAAFL
jgi:hypothetical protein